MDPHRCNVAEDEVEKALIAFSMLRTCEEEATAIEALKLIEDALTQAQQARFLMVFAWFLLICNMPTKAIYRLDVCTV